MIYEESYNSMIKEIPLLLKNICQKHSNLGFGSFVDLNHFNYLV